ncbi:hypothetical protein FHS89_000335 [Rubricella aquisinus]|uniref:DUF484 family protein n=1 Tax=Rubricella aquisinus TaxID=2028108 RepID=A0A840X0Z6_9RHOB|nr:DUF484 family protein [Rubricella aquisinus]MBB5514337.1 hypothetical protein [Rubricella aquisinus]
MTDAIAAIRETILAHPDIVLDDREVMARLLDAGQPDGGNIVDLRGVFVERLEGKLGQLEETHRSVLAAAYENIAGTNAIQRAVLSLLEPQDFAGFLSVLQDRLAPVLTVDEVHLVLEADGAAATALDQLQGVKALPKGSIATYFGDRDGDARKGILLRAVEIDGIVAPEITSEAVLRLDLGPGRRAAMLVFGAQDAGRFAPDQGTDLLAFFAGCFERIVRRWIE